MQNCVNKPGTKKPDISAVNESQIDFEGDDEKSKGRLLENEKFFAVRNLKCS